VQLLISADMNRALVCGTSSNWSSSLQILYGNPNDYAYKFGNDTFEHKLPIHHTGTYFDYYDLFHSITIDYWTSRVFYSNHAFERLGYTRFVRFNDANTYFFGDVPNTNQVTKR